MQILLLGVGTGMKLAVLLIFQEHTASIIEDELRNIFTPDDGGITSSETTVIQTILDYFSLIFISEGIS